MYKTVYVRIEGIYDVNGEEKEYKNLKKGDLIYILEIEKGSRMVIGTNLGGVLTVTTNVQDIERENNQLKVKTINTIYHLTEIK